MESEIVCFLGFGYEETNMKRLLGPLGHILLRKLTFGTAFGLTAAEKNHIIETRFDGKLQMGNPGWGNLQFLREMRVLF